jgi:fructose-1,6-bisphosphatase/inositol monophosphatase family enzyme
VDTFPICTAMNLTQEDLIDITEAAVKGAVRAGEYIASCAGKTLTRHQKRATYLPHEPTLGGASEAARLVTDVDLTSEHIIIESLLPVLKGYDIGLLCEEREDDNSRFVKDYFIAIDPLDGTLHFSEGKSGYSVAIALIDRSGEPLVGVVFDPAEQTLYQATRGCGARINERPFTVPPIAEDATLSLIHDRSFGAQPIYPAIIEALSDMAAKNGYHDVHAYEYGGSVINGCKVLENNPALFFKLPQPGAGGGCIWDFAATACIYREVGAHATDVRGKALHLNGPSRYLNHQGVLFTGAAAVHEHAVHLCKDLVQRPGHFNHEKTS